MDELAKNKIKYILFRYKIDSKNLSPSLRLELLKKWIDSCVDSEEYEMAFVLKEKRNELIRSLRLARVGNRHYVDNLFIKAKWILRKFKRKFSRK